MARGDRPGEALYGDDIGSGGMGLGQETVALEVRAGEGTGKGTD